MAEIRESAANACIPPLRIRLRHSHDELANLDHDPGPSGLFPSRAVVPVPSINSTYWKIRISFLRDFGNESVANRLGETGLPVPGRFPALYRQRRLPTQLDAVHRPSGNRLGSQLVCLDRRTGRSGQGVGPMVEAWVTVSSQIGSVCRCLNSFAHLLTRAPASGTTTQTFLLPSRRWTLLNGEAENHSCARMEPRPVPKLGPFEIDHKSAA